MDELPKDIFNLCLQEDIIKEIISHAELSNRALKTNWTKGNDNKEMDISTNWFFIPNLKITKYLLDTRCNYFVILFFYFSYYQYDFARPTVVIFRFLLSK